MSHHRKRGIELKNPWLKKNPFLSVWLSAANSTMSRARGYGTAAVRREVNKAATTAATAGTKQAINFWASVLTPPKAPRRKRKRC